MSQNSLDLTSGIYLAKRFSNEDSKGQTAGVVGRGAWETSRYSRLKQSIEILTCELISLNTSPVLNL